MNQIEFNMHVIFTLDKILFTDYYGLLMKIGFEEIVIRNNKLIEES